MKKFNHKNRGLSFGVPTKTRSGFVGCQLSLVVALAALALPQAGQAGWWRTYGGTDNEVGNCIQITKDSNYIISGAKEGNLWLLKVDTSGNVLWENTYSSSQGLITRWIEETNDGGYIVATWTPSLLKVNSQGDTMWSRDYGIYSYCVQITLDNAYILTGGDHGNDYDERLTVVKTDLNGNAVWSKNYAEPGNNRNVGPFIQKTNDGCYIVFGLTGYIDPEYNEWSKVWLVKIDSEGNKLWSKAYGREEYGYTSKAYCGRQTNDGGYIITGVSNVGLWLLKTDSLGDTLWTKGYNTTTGGTGFSIQLTKGGGYIITGVTENFYSAFNAQSAQLWLLKTDANGDTLWTRSYGGNEGDVGRCAQQTEDSGYIIAGYTLSFGAGGSDLYLLKTDSLGLLCVTEEPSSVLQREWFFCQSIGPRIVLRYYNFPNGFQASVFDASGRKVDELNTSLSIGTLMWGDNQPPGVYFIQAQKSSNAIQTKRIVLIR